MRDRLKGNSLLSGTVLLVVLLGVGSKLIDGFTSSTAMRAMAVLAAFLGIVCVGQTLVALLGGLDLSIPFVVGSANILTMWCIGHGWNAVIAVLLVSIAGAVVGLVNGLLTLRHQGQSLIVTLAVGFTSVGLAQIVTVIGSATGGPVSGDVPPWLVSFSSAQGSTWGVPIPPIVLLWAFLAVAVILAMRYTTAGRAIYAVGGNRVAASFVLVSEARTWCSAFALSGLFAALAGAILLGFTGGAFVSIGDPYLFTSIAAVVVGGTSLLGGRGGYAHTVIGVLVLTVLGTMLVGLGLSPAGQQVVLGLLIVPVVAVYARLPHPRDTV